MSDSRGIPLPPGWQPSDGPPPVVALASLGARIEMAVRDVFTKRFAGREMPYERAAELVWLERDLVSELVFRLEGRDK